MYKAELDVPVALIFFTRPETLREVFKKVRKARPSKLFLIQDGERNANEQDKIKIQQCREIVNDIDWECEVFKNYSDVNLGCGTRPYTGISWVFEHVDRAIILEDDCIPADSFFLFCKEMLERYKDDSRIGIISGLNYFKEYDFGGYSYGFVKSGAIWGWATWKDRWEKYEYDLKKIDEIYIRNNILLDITPKFAAKRKLKTWDNARKELKQKKVTSYWDYQWGFIRHANSWLSIVPKYNQITNIGIGTGSTHSGNNIKLLPKKIANFFFMDVKELEQPLKHPDFVLPDRLYDAKYYKIIYPNLPVGLLRRISSIAKRLYYK
ncbi:glycosyltransferase family 2 protein [Caldibacillus sp. 210928-DFI.2.22]|uniref:glycosyltransferase family 2 protein n=1 Tax=unclassified Caldibacillus TaxID=2641266 RepID=UPI001D08076D|nr:MULTISPECIES: glycosyltransferase family 2 protein [unclassified Caldibacillus]MCB7070216.1 glycosyltransferase family 2 protein [Caldibacillus sp. 210928-DFI.2.22]MCB7073825.1 glycosyltransferase family 2 protein [Caldibacillus sp. 210928-DFI.2.18]